MTAFHENLKPILVEDDDDISDIIVVDFQFGSKTSSFKNYKLKLEIGHLICIQWIQTQSLEEILLKMTQVLICLKMGKS